MKKDAEGRWVDDPVHIWFGMTRDSYFVMPRAAMQAMPLDWQERFVALMNEAEATGLETPSYHVLRDDPAYTHVARYDDEDETSRPYEFTAIKVSFWLRSPRWSRQGGRHDQA